MTNPEVSMVPTQADREAAANGLRRAREAMMDGRLPRCGQLIVAAEEMERAEAVLMRREPLSIGLVEQMAELVREMASQSGPEPRFIERARAVVSRLAHQTPPATQPIATVGEVEQLIASIEAEATDWRHSAYSKATFREIANRASIALATLHTPPPVATATAMDAIRPMTEDEAREVMRHNSEHAIIETLRKRGLIAATPTPPAGGR